MTQKPAEKPKSPVERRIEEIIQKSLAEWNNSVDQRVRAQLDKVLQRALGCEGSTPPSGSFSDYLHKLLQAKAVELVEPVARKAFALFVQRLVNELGALQIDLLPAEPEKVLDSPDALNSPAGRIVMEAIGDNLVNGAIRARLVAMAIDWGEGEGV